MRPARPVPEGVVSRIALWAMFHFRPEVRWAAAEVRRYVQERDWIGLNILLPRGLRWALLRKLKPYLSDVEYWSLLRETYEDSETAGTQGDLRRFFTARRGARDAMMTAEEQAVLASLPDPLTVYRGCWDANRRGWSWTLSEERAQWFAQRCTLLHQVDGLVLRGRIARGDVLAYLDGREEQEVLCDPAKVAVESVETVRKANTETLPSGALHSPHG